MTVVQRAHAEGDEKPWFVNQVASHIAAGERRMSARIEERIAAVEERMSARIEKTETAFIDGVPQLGFAGRRDGSVDRSRQEARRRQLHSAYKPFQSSCV